MLSENAQNGMHKYAEVTFIKISMVIKVMPGKTAYPARSIDELTDILRELDKKNPLIRLMLELETRTGLRNMDAKNLKFSQVMINGVVRDSFSVVQSKGYKKRLERGVSEATAKRDSTITIKVTDELKAIIEEIYELNGKNKLLFQSTHHLAKPNTAISIQYVNRILKDVAATLKLPYQLSTHSMRKSFAAMLLAMPGSHMGVIMKGLGHSSLNATQHYINTFHNETDSFTAKISFDVY